VFGAGAEELRALMARSRDVVLLAVVVGAVTGLLVALLDRLVVDVMLAHLRSIPLWLLAMAPGVGLIVTYLVLRYLGGRQSPSTADDYIVAMHGSEVGFELGPVPARSMGAVATLGLGGAGGLEGPSIYIGSAVGIALYDRVRGVLRGVDRRSALVAGAAAGVAAIFKAPATGAVFALEVPYQEDLARRSLLPAMVGAASGYTAFVALNGTDPIIPVAGRPAIDLMDIALAVAIGLACGFGARVFAWVMQVAKAMRSRMGDVPRVLGASALMAALVFGSDRWFDGRSLSIGPGYQSIQFALDPKRGLAIIALLATVRVLATAATFGGGGVAGMFVPLVIQGALTGRLMAGLFHTDQQSLCVVIGVAAFLGAGYRVPLAAVMFVAEATGRPGFVVPALIAATVAQLMMGDASVSRYQRRRRLSSLEERSLLPIASVLSADPATASAGDTLAEFFVEHVSLARRRAVPVVEGDGRFVGLVVLDDVLAVPPEDWASTTVADVVHAGGPTAAPDWSLGQALRAMVDGAVDHLPVVDASGHLRGVVTSDAVIDRARIMEDFDPPS
jgi:CIC family chloride channel protein